MKEPRGVSFGRLLHTLLVKVVLLALLLLSQEGLSKDLHFLAYCSI